MRLDGITDVAILGFLNRCAIVLEILLRFHFGRNSFGLEFDDLN